MKSKLAKCPECGNRGLKVTSNRIEEPTETAPGRGERITTCEKCGHRSVKPYTIAAKGSDKKDDTPTARFGRREIRQGGRHRKVVMRKV